MEKRNKNKNAEENELFWADKLAKEIITRKKFHYTEKEIPKFKEYVVKTSASLSGVLHIGRLSDTIRGDSVFKALEDTGAKAKLIWVAENMDPLRSIPKGVPEEYEKYIGMSVSDVPDHHGCHNSYEEHFKEKYFEVIDHFVNSKMEKFSMREEYKKGHFRKYIKEIMDNYKRIIEIQNKFRKEKLPLTWVPWTPICESCGKIITTKVTNIDDGKVMYKCQDYNFQKYKAKGCGFEGENDPLKGEGKLMWKSEWAMQWSHWNVCSEGAGKEYQVPGSAFWINGEICEKVLEFPMPVPIFYEHILIDNVKMSASLGNVVYPKEWLDMASPQMLRFFYNKRLMKTRSFSWKDLPKYFDDYDAHANIYFENVKSENEKESNHMKRLYGISQMGKIEKPLLMNFSYAVILSQAFNKKEDLIKNIKKTGHYQQDLEKEIFDRIHYAKNWLKKYAPDEYKFELQLSVSEEVKKMLHRKEKEALLIIVNKLKENKYDEKTLFQEFYAVSKEIGIEPKDFFRAAYYVLLNKEKGPKLAPFVLSLGDRAIKLIEELK